jgi:CDP-paratose 2-epimerase
MRTIIITGSAGLVGSESCFFFLKKGFKVIGIDNNFRRYFFGPSGDTNWIKKKLLNFKNYSHYSIDIRDLSRLSKIFKKESKKIKCIIHAAAQPSHDWAKRELHTDFSINALGTLNLLKLMKRFSKNASFIFLSTNKVYGDNPNKINFIEKKYRWEFPRKHIYFNGFNEGLSIDNCIHSFFGVSKTYADLLVQEFGKNFNLNTVVLRAGCITGPNHSGAKLHGFLSYLIKQAKQNKTYEIFGYKGKQVRDNIHSADLINFFWEFMKKPRKGEIYNIGGGRKSNCSILEAINIIEDYLKIKIKLKYNEKNRTGDHICYITNMKKIKQHYPNWKQKYTVKKIIYELINC